MTEPSSCLPGTDDGTFARDLAVLGRETDPHRLMRGIAETAHRLTRARAARLWALDVSREHLYLESRSGPAGPDPETSLPLGKADLETNPLIHTIRNGGPTFIPDIGTANGLDCGFYWENGGRPPGRSLLLAPLRNRDVATFALLELWDCPGLGAGTDETMARNKTIAMIELFCRQAAVWCENVHLRGEWIRMTGQSPDLSAPPPPASSSASRRADWSTDLVGGERAMGYVWDLLDRVAGQDTTVLLRGETGTGKDVAARALHRRSRRADRPFVAQNCAAVPEMLLESELFGYRKGAFTGADRDHPGLLQAANGGTLFLDEIGDMPLPLQAKLLRVLQERRMRPVGGTGEIALNIRLIAATHADLEQAVAHGRFRQDLFYRLSVYPIVLPPLRTRGGDILLLARHFLTEIGKGSPRLLDESARQWLLRQPFPGNVRQLRNLLERAVLLSDEPSLSAVHMIDDTPPSAPPTAVDDLTLREAVEAFERDLIVRKLAQYDGHQERTASALGLPRRTLADKLRKYGLAQHDSPGGV